MSISSYVTRLKQNRMMVQREKVDKLKKEYEAKKELIKAKEDVKKEYEVNLKEEAILRKKLGKDKFKTFSKSLASGIRDHLSKTKERQEINNIMFGGPSRNSFMESSSSSGRNPFIIGEEKKKTNVKRPKYKKKVVYYG